MKVIAGIVAHYGLQYAEQCIESIYPFVDKIVIMYSWMPSFGWWNPELKCPDKKEDFEKLFRKYPKITFYDITGKMAGEGKLRDWIEQVEAKDFDILIPLDLDEIMPENLGEYLQKVNESPYKRFGISGYKHFWKSFDYYLTDHFTPFRFINLKHGEGDGILDMPIYHCSYNQSDEIIKYKMATFTHSPEILPNWYKEKWLRWNEDTRWLHPVSDRIWEKVNVIDFELPKVLR